MTSSRKINLKIFASILFGMFMALVLVRAFAAAMDASSGRFLGSKLEALAALPIITQTEKPMVMVFGSSMVEAGFSPRQFDRQMAEQDLDLISYNFGFGGLNPYFQDYFTRRIAEQFKANNKRLDLVVIEFNPFQATKARWNGAKPTIDSFTALLASGEEMWKITQEDPARGILMAEIKYLRDGVSAQMATSFFGNIFHEPPQRSDAPIDEQAQQQREAALAIMNEDFDKTYPDYDGCNWCLDWQGGGTIPEERPAEVVQAYHDFNASGRNQRRMENDRLQRIRCCDIEGLDFEPLLLEKFVAIVENFKQISDRVEVIILPRNTKWINYSEQAEQRLATAIAYLEAETGLVIRNYQTEPRFIPEMYSDTTHFARYSGDVVFTDFLVEEFGPYLKQKLQ